MKKFWKVTAMAIALTLSLSTVAACGEDDAGTISGNYKEATAQETYATLSSINVDALQGIDPETGEAVENPRIAASIKNDLDFSVAIGEESVNTTLGLELQARNWEKEDGVSTSELAGKVNATLKTTQKYSQFIYRSLFSPNEDIRDSEDNVVDYPNIDLALSAEVYANDNNAFLKASTTGLSGYEGSVGASGNLYSASLTDMNFNWMYKFDMNELIALLMGGGEETVNSSVAPDSSDTITPDIPLNPEEPSLIETLGLTEEILVQGSTAFGLEYSLDAGRKGTKIKVATTEATKTALNAMLMANEMSDSSATDSASDAELPTQLDKFDIALYLQISDNGTPIKIAASIDVALTSYDSDYEEQYGSNKMTLAVSNYLDVDFSWMKNSVLPEGISESTDYQAVTVEEFMTSVQESIGFLF
ncbi:MAG: hypothetical protein IJY38_00640 [Clostridia bacterium]|nr:hypothetical protein [Clostridia bacterium]